MNKRDFLKTISLSSIMIHTSSFSQIDYSKSSPSNKYKYTSPLDIAQEESKNINQSQYEQIIPQNEINFWDKPRYISLHRVSTGERKLINYFSNKQINKQEYWFASYLLRDVEEKTMMYMDLKLLDLICAIQAWIRYYNINPEFQILSGLRTVEHNKRLLKPGKNNESAALNSMHIYGKAIDFYVPQLSVSQIAKIAEIFQAGGIGLYPQRNFIHLDTGRIRKWKN